MRLRNVPGADAYLTAHPLVIKNETRYRGTWKETFQNPENPIHIEIGMGKRTVSSDTCKGESIHQLYRYRTLFKRTASGAGTL